MESGTLARLRRALRLVGLLTVLLAVALSLFTGLPVLHAFYVAVLLVMVPGMGLLQARLPADVAPHRIELYASSAVSIGLLGSVALALGLLGLGAPAMGIGRAPDTRDLLWGLALTASGLAVAGAFRLVSLALGWEETRTVRELLPESGLERWVFALLSITAGVGEELAYRAFAIPVLASFVGSSWAAVGVSAVAFGLVHGYQGLLGVIRTAILGVLLGAGFVWTGSLWGPVVAHTALDLLMGLVLGRFLIGSDRRDPSPGPGVL